MEFRFELTEVTLFMTPSCRALEEACSWVGAMRNAGGIARYRGLGPNITAENTTLYPGTSKNRKGGEIAKHRLGDFGGGSGICGKMANAFERGERGW